MDVPTMRWSPNAYGAFRRNWPVWSIRSHRSQETQCSAWR